ncbi:DUF4124 domain-containing protein [Colwellia asteriadis]|uniref:DUF4124 domain-containing protein n=1 Tax=Colwellia asteriadis TaxID=517723 RepID=A0ABP3WCP3_9GAMM
MLTLRLLLLTLLVFIFAIPAYSATTKIYVWRNEQGALVFSDTPHPGAEEVKKTQSNIVNSSGIETKELDIKPEVITETYSLVIKSPQDNATIRDNTGSLYVSGAVIPKFKLGYTVQLYLDNKPHQKPQKTAIFSLQNVDRGEHKIKMELLDDKGKIIASSKPVTFYMHRATVN